MTALATGYDAALLGGCAGGTGADRMGNHVHELMHAAVAALFLAAGLSALAEYRALRERVVLSFGAMCLAAGGYAVHVVVSHNLPKVGWFWLPWTSVGLVVTFGATALYLLTMRSFLSARGRWLTAALAVQAGLVAVVMVDLSAQAAWGSSLLFVPEPRPELGAHRLAVGEGAYSLRPAAEIVGALFMSSFLLGVGCLLVHMLRARAKEPLVYAGLVVNAALVANEVLVALGVVSGVYLMAFSKGFEVVRIRGEIRARARARIERRLRQAQKMEALGRLAGGIAHDFNNVLMVVGGNVQLAQERTRKGLAAADELESAEEGIEAGRRLVRQLLDVARAKEAEPELLDLNEFLSHSTKLLGNLCQQSKLEVVAEPALGGVRISHAELLQVLMNLVVNARDAMPEGGTIRVRARARGPQSGADRTVVISVTDEGPGIPADVLEHVFEPFFTTKAEQGGTGLGLATLYSIVHKAGGQVEVDSKPGRGARFDVLLPRSDVRGPSPS